MKRSFLTRLANLFTFVISVPSPIIIHYFFLFNIRNMKLATLPKIKDTKIIKKIGTFVNFKFAKKKTSTPW